MTTGKTIALTNWTSVSKVMYLLFNALSSLLAQMIKSLPAMQEIQVQPLGLEQFPGGGHGNPLQYSCLENPMDRGGWQAIGLHRVRHN